MLSARLTKHTLCLVNCTAAAHLYAHSLTEALLIPYKQVCMSGPNRAEQAQPYPAVHVPVCVCGSLDTRNLKLACRNLSLS